MRELILSIILMGFASVALSAPLSRAYKQEFCEHCHPSCGDKMRRTSTMTPDQIRKWCGCVCVETVNMLSKEDMRSGNLDIVQQKSALASGICEKKLLNSAGLFK